MNKFTLIFLSIGFLSLSSSCGINSNSENNMPNNELNFSNEDVNWDGSSFGLLPSLSEKALAFRNNYPEAGNDLMMSYLKEEDRFVFAHVILSFNHDEISMIDGKWNNLSVQLNADGSVVYNIEEMTAIQNYWTNKLKD